MQLDPRIGALSSGVYYAFADGYDHPETVGTLAQVQRALRLVDVPAIEKRNNPVVHGREYVKAVADQLWNVVLRFQYPAWDEADGIVYWGIQAKSKSEAVSIARRMAARDGHTVGGGKGRYWFAAQGDGDAL
jgi:hypothetical protein